MPLLLWSRQATLLKAGRIAFFSGINCPYAPMLRDLLTPVSEGVTGIVSSRNMFGETTVSRFSSSDFFDETVAGVTDMGGMFLKSAFNQDIGGWDVSRTHNLSYMFRESLFDQDISGWNVSGVTTFESFLEGSQLSAENYNELLIKWSGLELENNITFDAGSSKYDLGLPQDRRDYIINEFGWDITDGGTTGNNYQE